MRICTLLLLFLPRAWPIWNKTIVVNTNLFCTLLLGAKFAERFWKLQFLIFQVFHLVATLGACRCEALLNATFVIDPDRELTARSFIVYEIFNTEKLSFKECFKKCKRTFLGRLLLNEDLKVAFLDVRTFLVSPQGLDLIDLMALIVIHHASK